MVLERGSMALLFKGVPAEVCEKCGEAYVDAGVSDNLLESAETAVRSGVELEVREFFPAAPR